MAKSKTVGGSLAEVGAALVRRVRRDAETLITRGRAEALRDLQAMRRSTHRAVRDLERKVVRQFHAATTEQVKRLERRVAKLERLVGDRATSSVGKVA